MPPVWIQWLSALLTPVIGVITTYVAWQQWRTAHGKLRLDLFEKRIAIYSETMSFVAEITRDAAVTPERILQFKRGTQDSLFPFPDPAIQDKLRRLEAKAWDLRAIDLAVPPRPAAKWDLVSWCG